MTRRPLHAAASIVEMVAHESPIGDLWSTWTESGLYSLGWKKPDRNLESSNLKDASQRACELDRLLAEYFHSGSAVFSGVTVDPAGWTSFTANVYRCCRQIGSGETQTYKQLATAAGNEMASRAVGAAMARNRVLLVIPCHRVLSAQGQLRGFSARGGLATKRQLLDLEKAGSWPQDLFSSEV